MLRNTVSRLAFVCAVLTLVVTERSGAFARERTDRAALAEQDHDTGQPVGQGQARLRAIRLMPGSGWALSDAALFRVASGYGVWTDVTPSGVDAWSIRELEVVNDAHGWLLVHEPPTPENAHGSLGIVATQDGGRTWRDLSRVPLSEDGMAGATLSFVDTRHGWLMLHLPGSSASSLGELYRTRDGGSSWTRLAQPPIADRVGFVTRTHGWLAGGPGGRALYRSIDAGETWTQQELEPPPAAYAHHWPFYGTPVFQSPRDGLLPVTLTSEEGDAFAVYVTGDGGNTWTPHAVVDLAPGAPAAASIPAALLGRETWFLAPGRTGGEGGAARPELVDAGAPWLEVDGAVADLSFRNGTLGWALVGSASCAGHATGCRQETRLYETRDAGDTWRELFLPAPPELPAGSDADSTSEAPGTPEADLAPGGWTSINGYQGFDSCSPVSLDMLRIWWAHSPYEFVNFYFGDLSNGCERKTPQWVSEATAMGWGLVPTWLGPRNPCQGGWSPDPATARARGAVEADLAVAEAESLGLRPGTILYYDVEAFDGCTEPARSLIRGWVDRLHSKGWKAGVYMHKCDVLSTQLWTIPTPPDAMWMSSWKGQGTWDSNASVWNLTCSGQPLSNSLWGLHERLVQYEGDHGETWGGLRHPNIDSDAADGPVVGYPRVVTGDWNGDGRDAIWTYQWGWWTVPAEDASGAPVEFGMGLKGDYPLVGDWDGDGDDDIGTFRPGQDPSHFYLDTNRNAAADWIIPLDGRYYQYLPIAGDWDGDGDDDVGVWDAIGGWFYLYEITGPTTLVEHKRFQMGNPTDWPLSGDWDRDGRDEVGLFRNGEPNPDTNNFYFRKENQTVIPLTSVSGWSGGWGVVGDVPAAGDWDGDGDDNIGLYRAGVGAVTITTAPEFGPDPGASVETLPATAIGQGEATLNARVNPNGLLTSVFFEYGTTTNYGETTPDLPAGWGTTPVELNLDIWGLSCETIYHIRAVARSTNVLVNGDDRTFTTEPCPDVETLPVGQVGQTRATLRASINPRGAPANLGFEYGTSTSYGSRASWQPAGSGSSARTMSFTVSDLACATRYHYRALGSCSGGWVYGDDMTFETAPCIPAPTAIVRQATGVGLTEATLNASINPNGLQTAVFFDYGTTTNYGSSTPGQMVGWGTTGVIESQPVTGLSPGTTYHFRARTNGEGETVFSEDQTFATLTPPQPELTILSPNGGETLVTGSVHEIRWTSANLDPAGRLYLSYWYEAGWEPIVALDVGAISHPWTVPDPPVAESSIYIRYQVGSVLEAADISDDPFSIVGPPTARPLLYWRHAVSGDDRVWKLDDQWRLESEWSIPSVPTQNWAITGTGDFDSDGQDDILWRNTNNMNAVWFMDYGLEVTRTGSALLDPAPQAWVMSATGDLDGDGQDDILWRSAKGSNAVWLMDETTLVSAVFLTPVANPAWKMVGTGDFNGDGEMDILWRNELSGKNVLWLMDGTDLVRGVFIQEEAELTRSVGGIGDFNDDDSPDILWRDYATGDNFLWLMDGTDVLSIESLPDEGDVDWRLVGPR